MDARVLCLGVLTKGDATGYEIRKSVTEGPFSHFYAAGYGSIYPALNRLDEEGFVRCTAMAQENRPDKKVYSITAAGRLAFLDALAGPTESDHLRSPFTFKLFFGELQSPRDLDRMIAERIAWYRACMARMEGRAATPGGTPGERFARAFGLAIYQAAAEFLEAHGHELVGQSMVEPPQERPAGKAAGEEAR